MSDQHAAGVLRSRKGPGRAARSVRAGQLGIRSSLVSTPTRNMKETVDKKLIVDLLTFAWEVRERGGQPCVVLITGDGDYSYTLSKLNDRGVLNAVFFCSDKSTADILKEIAMDSLSFEKDVLGAGVAAATASSSAATIATATITTATVSGPHISQIRHEPDPLPPSNDLLQQRGTKMQSEASRYVFLTQMPKGIEAREVYRFLNGTYGIGVQRVMIEVLKKDATGRTRFAHVQCSAKDADYLVALSVQNGLVYKEENINAVEDSKPPLSKHLRRVPSNLIYTCQDAASDESTSEEENGKRRYLSPMKNSPSIGEVDGNILALCVCLAIKQKSWGQYKETPAEECWVPNNILQGAFQACDVDKGVPNIFRAVQDSAIASGHVETARHRRNGGYVPIKLTEPTTNLSSMHYLRLTASGRACADDIREAEVESFCSALYRKQRGTGIPFERCWIMLQVVEETYAPDFPLKEEKGVSYQRKETRDSAIASGYVLTARKDLHSDRSDFIIKEMWDSCENGRLSDDIYFQLTTSGRRLGVQSLTPRKRPAEKKRKTSASCSTVKALSMALSTSR
eukprot:CAMPEP_0181067080 /NCGR_PEP_ID=MMETSP1070-20121207/25679_1 /TAXON_ID=265543 /ORGANISM="Minutocellus polymorphus, Strain NH13" /LENGTH=568 /DNA_ID=CAMNT_0023147709 /DNA_START=68 /DNA_END=1774 /DNA_ORIENTATION=-